MEEERVSGSDVARILAGQVDLPVSKAKTVLQALSEVLSDELAAGGRVVVSGFGTLHTTVRKGRKYRDLHTQEERSSPARRVVKFSQGQALAQRLNPSALG